MVAGQTGFLNDPRVDFYKLHRHTYKRILIIFRNRSFQKMLRKLQVFGQSLKVRNKCIIVFYGGFTTWSCVRIGISSLLYSAYD